MGSEMCIRDSSGADISFDATINDEKTIITIDPVNDFVSGQVVYVSIGATLEDYSDNATAAASSIFSTIDNIAPAITITPSDGATEVAKDANITIAFSEPIRKIDDSDLTDTNVDALITLKDTNVDGADISFDATVNTEKTAIIVNPTNNFSKGQIVYVRIDALVEDSFDNVVLATNSIFTVTGNQRPIAGKIRDGLLAEDIDLINQLRYRISIALTRINERREDGSLYPLHQRMRERPVRMTIADLLIKDQDIIQDIIGKLVLSKQRKSMRKVPFKHDYHWRELPPQNRLLCTTAVSYTHLPLPTNREV